jgi:hypothetical protein
MKRFILLILHFLKRREERGGNNDANISFVGSWRLISIIDSQGKKRYPRWKEVWSFAAMNEGETNGIYACDYINLHTVIGKWELTNKRLKLVRKECENEYVLAELSGDKLILKPKDNEESFVFQRVV